MKMRKYLLLIVAVLLMLVLWIVGRNVQFVEDTVPLLTKAQALERGFLPLSGKVASRQEMTNLVEICMVDFKRLKRGDARLYRSFTDDASGMVIIVFSRYRDEWWRDVYDSNIAYVCDPRSGLVVAKFWFSGA